MFQLWIQICILFLFSSTSCLAGVSTVEEQMEQLRNNYIEMKQILALKDSRLETLEFKVQQHDLIAAKMAELESKVTRLEAKDKQQEEKVTRLELALQKAKETNVEISGKSVIPRTCREAQGNDPTLSSGMYWIDPDGQGVGDAPINVHCDMQTGTTAVPHDSESSMDSGNCVDPGCYSRAVNYNASSRQMKMLSELSAECHQSISYECNYAPLEYKNVQYSWWNDNRGNPHYFWAGNDSSVHTCQCGIEGNCIDPTTKCNCDAILTAPQVDNGVITDKTILPISRINYGRTSLETSSGVHTLGRFECSGQVALTGTPSSCEDLWRIGHSLSGLYSVIGSEMVESVYCDFTLLPSDSGFQTWIGYADVKSSPTYFYVQLYASHFSQTNVPIPFDRELLNVGGAMNSLTGKFKAPVAGRYFFAFTGLVYFPLLDPTTRQYLEIGMFKNGVDIGKSFSDEISSAIQYESLSLQSTLHLEKGDEIWLQINSMTRGAYPIGNSYTHFNGFLLEEDISQSSQCQSTCSKSESRLQ